MKLTVWTVSQATIVKVPETQSQLDNVMKVSGALEKLLVPDHMTLELL